MEVLVGAKGERLCGLYHCSVFGFFFVHAGNQPRFGNLDLEDNIEALAVLVLPHGPDLRPEAGLSGTVLGTDIANMVDLVGWMGFGLGVFHRVFGLVSNSL